MLSNDLKALVAEIDRVFEEISGEENAAQWTPKAVADSPVWAEQRERARRALDLLGEQRDDAGLRGRV